MTFFDTQTLLARALVPVVLTITCLAPGVGRADGTAAWETMKVTATSFTLAENETKRGNVGLTAFGDQLKPTSKAIAVSRDLLHAGLDYGTRVKIEDLPGTYTVRDKMARRWHDKIDILFAGKKRARAWGKQEVQIRFRSRDPQ